MACATRGLGVDSAARRFWRADRSPETAVRLIRAVETLDACHLQRGEDRARAGLQDEEDLRHRSSRSGCPAQSFVIGAFAVAAVIGFGVAAAVAWLVGPLAVVWLVTVTNFYNFMDGIDGLAAGQGFASCAGVIIGIWSVGAVELAVVLAAACLGFLLLNSPPARIFLGDVGSYAL